MNEELTLRSMLDAILANIVHGLTDFVPRVLVAIIVVLIGWLIASIVQKVLTTVFAKVHLDTALEKMGLTDILGKIGLKEQPSRLVPKIIYYLILIFILQIASESAGLSPIANAINAALAFVPNIVAALILILLGTLVSQFAGRAVTNAAKDSGVDYASVLGKLTASLVVFVVAILAIAQLKINMAIVNSVVLIIFGGFGLCFALSFGLGTREITRNLVAGFYARRMFKIGDEVEINGERGTVKSFAPLVTFLERDELAVAISNSALLTSVGRR